MQILSMSPRIVVYPKFLSAAEIARFVELATPHFHKSTLALKPGETEETTAGIRTSQGMFVTSKSDVTGLLTDVERRIAQVTGLPAENGEVRTEPSSWLHIML